MFDFFRKIRLNITFSAVLTIILGIILVAVPGAAVKTVFLAVGWMLIVSGVVSLLSAAFSRGQPVGQGDFVLGLIQIATGLVVLMRPGFLLSLVGLVLGFVLLLHGVRDIQSAREAKALGYGYKFSLIVGIVTLAMGFVIMVNPFTAGENLLRLAGLFLILDGAGDLLVLYRGMR